MKYVLELIKQVQKVPEKFLKHLTEKNGFDKGKLIVLFNGFKKKSQKTPKNELEKALSLMNEYFQQKKF